MATHPLWNRIKIWLSAVVPTEGESLVVVAGDSSVAALIGPVAGSCNGAASSTLAELGPGQRGRVTGVAGTGAIRQRLLDMGILPGAVVEVERIAPAGDPIWIEVDGTHVSLRRAEAATIAVAGGE